MPDMPEQLKNEALVESLEPRDSQDARFSTVDFYDPKVKAQAYDLFLNTSNDLHDISIALGVPKKTVAGWAKTGNWLERKKEIERLLFLEAEEKYKQFIIENRLPTAKRQLEAASKIEEGVIRLVNHEMRDPEAVPDSRVLRSVSETLVAAASVSSKVVGIHDKMFDTSEQVAAMHGKVPLVQLNVHASLPPGREPREAIDVDVVEVKKETTI